MDYSYGSIPSSPGGPNGKGAGAGLGKMMQANLENTSQIATLFFQEKIKSEDVTELVQVVQKVENLLKYEYSVFLRMVAMETGKKIAEI